ncbi:MAG: cardiolipin synthase [Firmicutes bacterium]|nr:cardiolipin synthase [Bacillota bacterium]
MSDNRNSFWQVLFGRTSIFITLVAIQVFAVIGGVAILGTKVLIANHAIGVLAVLIIVYLLNTSMNSSFKLMWIILIIATPIIGVPFYFYTRVQPGTKFIAKRVDTIIKEQEEYLLPDLESVRSLADEYPSELGIFKYLYEKGNYPIYRNTAVKYFPSGEDKFHEMLIQLKRAKKFIFLEYFIIGKGYMWDSILEILEAKAQEGVEVRVMYDGTCMMSLLPFNYPDKLKKKGIKCKVFSPMKPFLSTHQNNRDHRKILVIDGHTAFTGGVNLADEYINEYERFGHWKDTAIMLKGEAVDSFTLMFLQMWNISSKQPENYLKYIKQVQPLVLESNDIYPGGYIAPYGDSPLDTEEVGKRMYIDILNRAKDYVHIMTPYLIIDEEMVNALTFAAERGVDVRIIMPHIPDKKYAYFLARTYYEELIKRGVKIYEYTPGFVHAKVFVSDDEKAVVGTINLDFRSLFLHFECATYIYRNPVVLDIETDYLKTLERCHRITLRDCKDYPKINKVAGKALKLIAPLM